MIAYQSIFDWLVNGAPGASNPAQVVDKTSKELLLAGIPLARVEAFVRTLHPFIVGRSFLWTPEIPLVVMENSYSYLQSPEFLKSPAAKVFQTGQAVRCRLFGEECGREFFGLEDLSKNGFTDFWAGPLSFLNGEVHAITFATRAEGGFTSEHIAVLKEILRPLSRIGEIYAQKRTAVNLLNTYVGHDAGERILAGNIQRGETNSLRAVIWFSDLRGFTVMSSELSPGEITQTLNDLFDCQVLAITRHSGEVLKFIGDGLLAIFSLEGKDRTQRDICDGALLAAEEAFEELGKLNQSRADKGSKPIQFGLALHLGLVSYGNIGGKGRLDFTCIGPAVNLAARLEGLTSKLEQRILMSAQFAQATGRLVRKLGSYELKGVKGSQDVFAPGILGENP